MRVCGFVLAVGLAACGQIDQSMTNSTHAGDSAATFPVKGEYHRISDRTVNGQLQRMETDGPLDASTRESFERLVAGADIDSCRDRQVDIGKDSFSVRMTCDGYGGEATLVRHGNYSKDSVDITYEATRDGATTTETVSYRLNRE